MARSTEEKREALRLHHKKLHAKRSRQYDICPPPVPVERICYHCHEMKPGTDFRVSKCSRDGLHGYCRICQSALDVARRKTNIKELWASHLISHAKARARRCGFEFDLDERRVREIFWAQDGCCYWYGVPLLITAANKHPQKPSLDRLDCAGGYTRDNTVLACIAANFGRIDSDADVFRAFCGLLRGGLK